MSAFTFRVEAKPHPQGSHHVEPRRGQHVVVANNAQALAAWRNAVCASAYTAWWKAGKPPAITGPAVLVATFYLPRPQRTKWPLLPAGPPDLSKLLRATEDGIVVNAKRMGATILHDDALITDAMVTKRWAGVEPFDEPVGALVTVWPAGEVQLIAQTLLPGLS